MYQRKLDKDIRCPLEYGLEIFGGKGNVCCSDFAEYMPLVGDFL